MLTIQNIALATDIARLPKGDLEDLCSDLDLPVDGAGYDLAMRIWGKVNSDAKLQDEVLLKCKPKLLCGRTAATWYKLTSGASLEGSKGRIQSKLDFDPFTTVRIPQNIKSTPVIISGSQGDTDKEYFLRFIYKSPNARIITGTSMESIPRSSISTVYVNEDSGIIEIRADYKSSPKIMAAYSELLGQQSVVEPVKIAAKYGNKVEPIADDLGGVLIDATTKPRLELEDLSLEQAKAVVDILVAIDEFSATEDIELLRSKLVDSREVFGDSFSEVPFAAIVMAGLGKVGFGADTAARDLRVTPLYEMLKPYLESHGGHIRFSVVEEGITNYHTVQVGITTNSIFFKTIATESVIRFVRDRVIIDEKRD